MKPPRELRSQPSARRLALAVLALTVISEPEARADDSIAGDLERWESITRLYGRTVDDGELRLQERVKASPDPEHADSGAIDLVDSTRDDVAEELARVTFVRNKLADGTLDAAAASKGCRVAASDALRTAFHFCLRTATLEISMLRHADASLARGIRSDRDRRVRTIADDLSEDDDATAHELGVLATDLAARDRLRRERIESAYGDVTKWLAAKRRLLGAEMWRLVDITAVRGLEREARSLEAELYRTFEADLPARGEAFLRTRLDEIATTRSELDRYLDSRGGRSPLSLEVAVAYDVESTKTLRMDDVFLAEPVEKLRAK